MELIYLLKNIFKILFKEFDFKKCKNQVWHLDVTLNNMKWDTHIKIRKFFYTVPFPIIYLQRNFVLRIRNTFKKVDRFDDEN